LPPLTDKRDGYNRPTQEGIDTVVKIIAASQPSRTIICAAGAYLGEIRPTRTYRGTWKMQWLCASSVAS